MNQQKMKDLFTYLNALSIDEIEDECKSLSGTALEARTGFLFRLYYLEFNSRYKDNPVYATSTFRTYIRQMYMLPYVRYRKEIEALVNYPMECEKLGVGPVAEVRDKCGTCTAEALAEMVEAGNAAKFDQIINKYSRPKPPAKTRPTIKELEAIIHQREVTIQEMEVTIAELEEQVERLKVTVGRYKEEFGPLPEVKRRKAEKTLPDLTAGEFNRSE